MNYIRITYIFYHDSSNLSRGKSKIFAANSRLPQKIYEFSIRAISSGENSRFLK